MESRQLKNILIQFGIFKKKSHSKETRWFMLIIVQIVSVYTPTCILSRFNSTAHVTLLQPVVFQKAENMAGGKQIKIQTHNECSF